MLGEGNDEKVKIPEFSKKFAKCAFIQDFQEILRSFYKLLDNPIEFEFHKISLKNNTSWERLHLQMAGEG